MLAYGVTLALLHRQRGGRAQAVESALLYACIALQAHRFIWLEGDAAPETAPPSTALYRAYATADGFIAVAAIAERLWQRLCRALDLEGLLADPRYAPWATLVTRRSDPALIDALAARFLTRSTEEWLKLLVAAACRRAACSPALRCSSTPSSPPTASCCRPGIPARAGCA